MSVPAYVAGSKGEFTVAKDQNVRLRTGWFSDRSATYLAAGRPVVTQETGFSEVVPAGEGLLAFSTAEGAADAVQAIVDDYDRHSRSAREITVMPMATESPMLSPIIHATGSPFRTTGAATTESTQSAVRARK